jgi:diguanylate cyclase (GGDEF)-like protein
MKLLAMTIRTKLILALMIFSIIPMGFVALHLYRHATTGIQEATIKHLDELATLKSNEIIRYIDQVRIDLITAQDFVALRVNTPILAALNEQRDDPRYIAARRMIEIQTVKYASDHHINDIDILSSDGTVLYSDDMDDMEHIERETHSVSALLREGQKGIYFTEVFRKRENGTSLYYMFASAPLNDLKGKFIGIIVFELNLNRFFERIQATTGLGGSGETLIGKRTGDSVHFLNPLRHASDSTPAPVIKLGDARGVPVQLAASGQSGSGIGIDYRGVEVVAAWRYIPAVAWGIVVKTDSSEAYSPMIELRNDLLAAGALAFAFGMIFSLWLAHSMSRPIRALQKGAEELGRGNLEYQVPISSNDEIGLLSQTFNQMAVNLKEMTVSRDQIRHQANHDPLTGLPNRLLLEDRLQQALIEGRRENEIVAVMFLDLDGFKAVNDLHGHDAGDILLKQVAIRLLHCVRERDTVARFGGDEFVIVFINVKGVNNISIIANKILRAFERSFDVSGISMNVKTSIGVSLYPLIAERAEDLLQLADEAMYQAKREGKNRYRIAGPRLAGTAPAGEGEAEAA